jgi:ABC-type multidrug transport system permease subunit
MPLRTDLAMLWSLMRRGLNEILRVPGAALPGMLAPTIFLLGLTAVFGRLTEIRGFPTDTFMEFILPVSFMQAAAFTGAATGVNLARDIEQGWFDRLLVAPAPRWVLLAGLVFSASLRVLLPITMLLIVGLALGVSFPGPDGLLIALGCAATFAAIAACWGVTLALIFKTQAAAPLMQAGMFVLVLFTTSYAPKELLADWLRTVSGLNPVTQVLEAVRQGFVADVTWGDTWPAMVTLAVMAGVFGSLAVHQLRRTGT